MKLPLTVQISLLAYATFVTLLDASNIYLLLPGNEYSTAVESPYLRISYSLSAYVYLNVHWLFTSHYLKVASMIRLTFSSHTASDEVEIIKRKKRLHVLDFAIYALLVIWFTICLA